MTGKKIWKVLDLLKTTTDYFSEKQIESPRLNAEMLLGKALNLKRVDLYVSFERPISDAELAEFRDMVRRRAGHEPIQYILGETEFMGLPFKTNPAVLIPRPETEILVEEILKLQSFYGEQEVTIIDLGTGSGCIPISLAHFWKSATLCATDISTDALKTAESNKSLNEIHNPLNFIQHDLFNEWPGSLSSKFDIIVSNPPYISLDEMEGLAHEVREFEPEIALTDGSNGLRFYRRIFELVQKQSTLTCNYLFLEMSGSQPKKIVELAANYSFADLQVINDLNDIPRVLKIEVSHD